MMCSVVMTMKAIVAAIECAIGTPKAPKRAKQRLDEPREGRLADPAEGEGGERDAELRRGEVGVEALGDPPRHPRAAAPLGRQLGELRRPHFDHREFGRHEGDT